MKKRIFEITVSCYRCLVPSAFRKKIWKTISSFPRHAGNIIRTPGVWLNYLRHEKDRFETQLAVVAIIKNEGPYIKEWIEYHKIVGVERFYLYDNESSDGLKKILEPYIKNGEVVYHYLSGIRMQMKAYNDAIKKYRNKVKWMAAVDVDEFIVPVSKERIVDVINDIERSTKKNFVALAVHWVVYGYSRHFHRPEGLVIENYTKSDGVNKHIKSIVNPRTVVGFSHPHHANHFFGLNGVNENGKVIKDPAYWNVEAKESDIKQIRINHYWTKSYEEFRAKIERGRADNGGKYPMPAFDGDYFSHCEEHIMNKYIQLLKNKISEEAVLHVQDKLIGSKKDGSNT